MTTAAAWVEECRAHLDAPLSEEGNQLAADYNAGSGSMTFSQHLGSIAEGAILSIGANTLRVMSVNPTAKAATVVAAWNGSTDADAASGSYVRVNPRFTDHRILTALNRALGQLSSPHNGLFQVATSILQYNSAIYGYDLSTTRLLDVLEVRRQVGDSTLGWPRIEKGLWSLVRPAPTQDFGSGVALMVKDGTSGFDVQVTYKTGFTPLTDSTTDLTVTGLHEEAQDLPPLGAAIHLMSGREVARNDLGTQGNARRATEVPAGAIARSYGGLLMLWQQRVLEEATRLQQQFPVGD